MSYKANDDEVKNYMVERYRKEFDQMDEPKGELITGVWYCRYGPKRTRSFISGIIAGVTMYAKWKDGKQVVGTMEESLQQVIEDIKQQLGWYDEEEHLFLLVDADVDDSCNFEVVYAKGLDDAVAQLGLKHHDLAVMGLVEYYDTEGIADNSLSVDGHERHLIEMTIEDSKVKLEVIV